MNHEIYNNICQVLFRAIDEFTAETRIRPNRIFLSCDVLTFMGSYIRSELVYSLREDMRVPVIKFADIEIEEVPHTKGLIEVGYVYRVPFRVNTEYRGDHE